MATSYLPKYASGVDSGWLSYTGGANDPFTGTIYYREIGNMVNVIAYGLHMKNDVAAKQIVTLKESLFTDMRPKTSCVFWGGSRFLQLMFMISSVGNLTMYNNNDSITGEANNQTADNIHFNTFYFTTGLN